jgi:hypothetical protein
MKHVQDELFRTKQDTSLTGYRPTCLSFSIHCVMLTSKRLACDVLCLSKLKLYAVACGRLGLTVSRRVDTNKELSPSVVPENWLKVLCLADVHMCLIFQS